MNILLDTTVQINRWFKPKDKEKLKKIISLHKCYSSTYVLGEYKANIVKDFVTLYNIMQIEDDLTEVYQRIAEVYSARQQKRLIYLLNDLVRMYDKDYALIKEHLEIYPEKLLRRFYYGINKELIDGTGCARANAILEMGEVLQLKGIECNKRKSQCEIKEFWERNKPKVTALEERADLPEKMSPILREFHCSGVIPKGNACRSMGDCVIALESLALENGKVLSTNKVDFLPICEHIGGELIEIDNLNVND